MDKQLLYNEIIDFLRSKGATKVAVFGSYARDEETKKSDLDLIVEFPDDMSLLKFVRIERELSEKIGIKVDLVLDGDINPLINKYVKNDLLVLM